MDQLFGNDDPTGARKGFLDGRSQVAAQGKYALLLTERSMTLKVLRGFPACATVVERRMKDRRSSEIHSRNPDFVLVSKLSIVVASIVSVRGILLKGHVDTIENAGG